MNNDLISREALKEAFANSEHIKETTDGLDVMEMLAIIEIIDNAPAVETACPHCDSGYAQGYSDGYLRGKEERPQGKWIEGENGNIKCNQCGCEIRYSYLIGNKPDFPRFCPDCGAKMKGGAE